MPRPPAHLWPCLIWWLAYGKKPRKADLPGLVIGPAGTYPSGVRVWRCCLEGLHAN